VPDVRGEQYVNLIRDGDWLRGMDKKRTESAFMRDEKTNLELLSGLLREEMKEWIQLEWLLAESVAVEAPGPEQVDRAIFGSVMMVKSDEILIGRDESPARGNQSPID
jgi:hypothetical protein